METLRRKYKTYGHEHEDALTEPLERIHDDLDWMVDCARNSNNNNNNDNDNDNDDIEKRGRRRQGQKNNQILHHHHHPPLAFLVPDYVETRHAELQVILSQDVSVKERPAPVS